MRRSNPSRIPVLPVLLLVAAAFLPTKPRAEEPAPAAAPDVTDNVTQGALRVTQKDGAIIECPLKHTDVQAQVSGFIARVKVTQTFHNPLDEKIEAVYVFPLPHESAVDDMTMVIGERHIVGLIKRRAEARQIYEEALRAGQTAALLEQERPNIFTQSVGNIGPKQEIRIEISYVDVLKYDLGTYEFHFPMVVGPRYIPGGATSVKPPVPPELQGKVANPPIQTGVGEPKGTGWSPDTTAVPDASRITPQVLKPGERNGHDIALTLTLDAGVPIRDLKVINHQAEAKRDGERKAKVTLSPADSIPNKDFVLRYNVVGDKPEVAVLCHTGASGQGYFMLMIQPKEDEKLKKSPPREMVFLIDVSGSMQGAPNAKCREAMKQALALCREQDTLQVITFAGQTEKLFEKAVPCTQENIAKALAYSQQERGSGGTEMLKGIQATIADPLDAERVRMVVMLSDGYIGNEAEIIEAVGKGCGDRIRFWVLGIGSSVNRFLVDGVAKQGGGMGKVVGLNEDPTPTVQEMIYRLQRAQLAKLKIDFGGVAVSDTYPAKLPELWAGRPVIVYGLYDNAKRATLTVSGEVEGEAVSWPLDVNFPAESPANGVLQQVWARQKIEDLMQQTYYQGSPAVEEAVTGIALDYRLMSQYTSFVAVDEKEAAKAGEVARPPRRMLVPVPMPEGVSYAGVFGGEKPGDAWGGGGWGEGEATEAGDVIGAVGGTFGVRSGGGRKMMITRYGGSRGVSAPTSTASPAHAAPPPPMSMASAPTPSEPTSRLGRVDSAFVNAYGSAGAVRNEESLKKDYDYRGDEGLSRQALYPTAQPSYQRASALLQEARELKDKGQLEAARAKFACAFLFARAAANLGYGGGDQGALAQAGLDDVSGKLVQTYTQAEPRLSVKLDLLIRDQSLAEALTAIVQRCGVKVELLPGSLDDAAVLLDCKEVRVYYLDLRNATAAQALDWLLRPARLDWWMTKGIAVAGTTRRGGLESGWVYDVARLALPSAKVLDDEKDYNKRVEIIKKASEEFLAGVRKGLSLKEAAAIWFAPGQILVLGDGNVHAAAAKLLSDLANPAAQVADDLKDLQKVTSQRAAERKDAEAKRRAAREPSRVCQALRQYSWPLLARAAADRVDLEALTELQIAWKDPALAELLKTPGGAVAVFRSLWALTEGFRGVSHEPGQLPLEAMDWPKLVKAASELSRPAANETLAALEKNPEDAAAFARVLYAALAYREDAQFLAKARAALLPAKDNAKPGPLDPARVLAKVLLGIPDESDNKALVELLDKNPQFVAGDDLVVLTALACRRAGGAAWSVFRSAQRDLLSKQALDGSVVVLVNSLAKAKLPTATVSP